jgi:5-hydroxyisourate hydrolase
MNRATISTHVLDTALGKPAAGIRVSLRKDSGGVLGEATTGLDGRVADLVPAGIEPGSYLLVFEVDDYFGERPHLFQTVSFTISIAEAAHHHVPLLIGPFSSVSYRGS